MAHGSLINFKILLQKKEQDLGLSDLSDAENTVPLAISDLCNKFENAKTQAVLQHQFASSMGRATIFRTLKKLEERKKISKSAETHGAYTLVSDVG